MAHAFVGGRILSMDPWRPAPEVVVVENGRIAAVGERALLGAFPGATREDLAGRALLPGFIDAHNHLSIAALHPLWERGSITPGKRADLVVVEGDLDAEHPPRVVETWVGGERVYTRSRATPC